MAFWGTEIKAGKPFHLSPNKSCGRLRISQATLGTSSSDNKSLVQCNVGNKTPVLLCTLLPEKLESCHLDLEFEEAEEVTFSVIGPGKVYLSGYFVSNVRWNLAGDDESESYGEDVGQTETERSDEDNDYENDSFIDDSEPVVFSPSPSSSLEIATKKRHGTKKGSHKCLKKKYEFSESDEDGAISQHKAADDKLDDQIESEEKSKRKRQDVSGNDDNSHEDKKVKKKKRKNNKENEASKNGLIIEDLEDGEKGGKIASSGNKVTIHYTGKLKKGGKVFDSTVGKDPLKFRIGKNRVMDGLELGVEGMRVGSKRRLHIPPALGYGSQGSARVPPDSWLIMDVELLRVR